MSLRKPIVLKTVENLSQICIDSKKPGYTSIAAGLFIKNQLRFVGLNFGNEEKTHPFAARYAKNKDAIFFHAECHSLWQATKCIPHSSLRDMKTTLVITRVRFLAKENAENPEFNHIYGNCKPCEGCTKAIIDWNVDTIYYTDDSFFNKPVIKKMTREELIYDSREKASIVCCGEH